MAAPLTPAQKNAVVAKWVAARPFVPAALAVAAKYKSVQLANAVSTLEANIQNWLNGKITDNDMATVLDAVQVAMGYITLPNGDLVIDLGSDSEKKALNDLGLATPSISSGVKLTGDQLESSSGGMGSALWLLLLAGGLAWYVTREK